METQQFNKICITLQHVNQIGYHFQQPKNEDHQRQNQQKLKFAEEDSTNFLQIQKPNNCYNKYQQFSFKNKFSFSMLPNKSKYIYKVNLPKDNNKQELQTKKVSSNGQTHPFKIVKKKIFPYEINNNHGVLQKLRKKNNASLPLRKILDWMMQAASLVYLPKDSFYRAAIIATVIYQNLQEKVRCNQKDYQWQLIACASLSLSAKLDNGSIPINTLLSKSFDKKILQIDISNMEIQIFKILQFKIPVLVNFFEEAILICHQWNVFLKQYEDCLKFSVSSLEILQKSNVKIQFDSPNSMSSQTQRVSSGYKRFIQFLHICDYIILSSPIRFLRSLYDRTPSDPNKKKGKWFQLPMTLALGMIMCQSVGENIPIRSDSGKTGFVIGLMQKFLISELQWSKQDVLIWKSQLCKFGYEQGCIQKARSIGLKAFESQLVKSNFEYIDFRVKMGDEIFRQEKGIQRYLRIQS